MQPLPSKPDEPDVLDTYGAHLLASFSLDPKRVETYMATSQELERFQSLNWSPHVAA